MDRLIKDFINKLIKRFINNNESNKKKMIAIGVLALIFIIFIVASLLIKKPEVQEIPDVPIGEHGNSTNDDKPLETDVSISEREVELTAVSTELVYILKNPKANLQNFGEYYLYDGYYVFPNRNIKIRKSFDKILNIVFFNQYKENIVQTVNVKTSSSDLIKELGQANHNENGIIVYKTKNYYIIFDTVRTETTVYFRGVADLQMFWNFHSMYQQTNDLKAFISSITKYYPAYTKYDYDSDGLELTYSDLGIRLYFKEFDSNNGIYLYSNFENDGNAEHTIDKLTQKQNVYYKNFNLFLKDEIQRADLEQRKKTFSMPEKIYSDDERYNNINVLKSYLNKKKEKDPETEIEKEYKALTSLPKYKVYYTLNSKRYKFADVSIISKTGNNHYNINTPKVADNLLLLEDYLFYSVANEGIFRININTGAVTEIIIGTGSFELKYVNGQYLYYDNTSIKAL